jgi:hypothetical protein
MKNIYPDLAPGEAEQRMVDCEAGSAAQDDAEDKVRLEAYDRTHPPKPQSLSPAQQRAELEHAAKLRREARERAAELEDLSDLL